MNKKRSPLLFTTQVGLLYGDLWPGEEQDIGGEVINESPESTKSRYCNNCQNRSEGKILKEIRFLVVFFLHESISKTSQ